MGSWPGGSPDPTAADPGDGRHTDIADDPATMLEAGLTDLRLHPTLPPVELSDEAAAVQRRGMTSVTELASARPPSRRAILHLVSATTKRVARTAAGVAAAVHLGTLVGLAGLGLTADGPLGDELRTLTIAAVYGMPAVLALLAWRRRPPLLLSAAVTALALALVPFSLQSFLLGPLGLAYLLAYLGLRGDRGPATRSALAAVVCPALGLMALVVPLLHADPVCYTTTATGTTRYEPAPGEVSHGSARIPAGSDVIEQGCTSDTTTRWEAAAGLGLAGFAVAAGLRLVRPLDDEARSPFASGGAPK